MLADRNLLLHGTGSSSASVPCYDVYFGISQIKASNGPCLASFFPIRGGPGSGGEAGGSERGSGAGRAGAAALGAAMLSLDFLDDVRRMNKRQLYYQVLNFGMIVSSALMIWKGLMVVTGSESPIVVVLSGSMEPAFHRGDLLFLTNRIEDPIRVGEIVVFRIEGREIPIVHRVLKIHEKLKSPGLLLFVWKWFQTLLSISEPLPVLLSISKKDVGGSELHRAFKI
ncbi:signal peptidase complex catalytic subunit SEC11A isoform 3-T3 [Amazona ochrocephala]